MDEHEVYDIISAEVVEPDEVAEPLELSELEWLIIAQALYNAVGANIKTGNPDNLRGRVNAYFLNLYEQTGATGFEARLLGQKVGTYGFAKTKAETERTELDIEITDYAALRECQDDSWLDWQGQYVMANIGELARQYVAETGELLPGVTLVTRTIPAKPAGIRPNGTLRVKSEKVAEALGSQLGDAVRGLLGGGE